MHLSVNYKTQLNSVKKWKLIIITKDQEEDHQEERNNVKEGDKDNKVGQWKLIQDQFFKNKTHNSHLNHNNHNNHNNNNLNLNSKFNSLKILCHNNYSNHNNNRRNCKCKGVLKK